jgi:DNA repair photolyase
MKKCSDTIKRKTLIYKTGVEYGDYTLNHVQGCSHGCKYPCYAYLMAKRFGKVKSYNEWIQPKLVENIDQLLEKEIPKLKSKIKSVHLCFTTDPFMYRYQDICNASVRIIKKLNDSKILCTVLTKGVLPYNKLKDTNKKNSFGITLISLNEKYRKINEPGSAPYKKRIDALKKLHDAGFKTWVSIEPYPTPNILEQDFNEILQSISFVDKIIFGRLNYNKLSTTFKNNKQYYNELSNQVIKFCRKNKIKYHIKNGTKTERIVQ